MNSTSDLRLVLKDALREQRLDAVASLITQIRDAEPQDVCPLHDGCGGDAEGFKNALKQQPYVVLASSCSHEGWGHHSCNVVVAFTDGRIAHAECGGCSCEGSGSWSYAESVYEAELLIPEDER